VIKAFIFYQTLTINHHHYGHAHACPYFLSASSDETARTTRFAIKNLIALFLKRAHRAVQTRFPAGGGRAVTGTASGARPFIDNGY
jgi:hypothetical protein